MTTMHPPRLSTIELSKEDMKFSSGHFTIFSATERERLHGHNFSVSASITAEVLDNGMCFDYGVYKKMLRQLCDEWDEYVILPALSPHIKIEEDAEHVYVIFNNRRMPFLREDTLILPIANATLEEFSRLLLEKLTARPEDLMHYKVHALTVKVGSGPGQTASATWLRG